MVLSWSYSGATNTATLSGAGTTTTFFADLVAADTAGGWGKFTADASGKQVIGLANITIGDDTNAAVCSDTEKMYLHGNASTLLRFEVYANSSLTLSKCYLNLNFPTTYSEVFGDITLTNCYLLGNGKRAWQQLGSGSISVTDSTLDNLGYVLRNSPVFNRVNNVGTTSWYIFTTTGTFNDLKVAGSLFLDSPFTATIKNSEFTGSAVVYSWLGEAGTATAYLINVTAANWHFTSEGSGGTWKHYRQYEFDLQVVDNDNNGSPVEGAVVNIYDKDNNLMVGPLTTDANGDIPTQTLTRGYYNQANGDTLQEYAPLLLHINADGYQLYRDEMSPTMKTKYQVSLLQDYTPGTKTIAGVTRDRAGAPLGAATVIALNTDRNIVGYSGVSDANGNYSVSVVEGGKFRIVSWKNDVQGCTAEVQGS